MLEDKFSELDYVKPEMTDILKDEKKKNIDMVKALHLKLAILFKEETPAKTAMREIEEKESAFKILYDKAKQFKDY